MTTETGAAVGSARPAPPDRGGRGPSRVVIGALGLWGVVHVAGGASLLAVEAGSGLEALGPSAADSVPADPGAVTEGLLRFHALNVLLGGVAVVALAVAWWRARRAWHLVVALGVVFALDAGLLAFMVVPGLLPVTQGLIGPVLALLATAGVVAQRERRFAPATMRASSFS
jgi:hypothetical protein